MGGVVHDGSNFDCPMRGKRALEVSIGKVRDVLSELSSACAADLLDVCADLADEQVASLLACLENAKAFIQLELRTYLQCWQELPWSFIRVADWDSSCARRHAREIVHKFDSAVNAPELHHPLTAQWLAIESPVRVDLLRFIDGEDLALLPSLRQVAMELLVVPTIERVQEGDHSKVHKATTFKKVSGSYVSLCLRAEECLSWTTTTERMTRFAIRIMKRIARCAIEMPLQETCQH
jgi:hypothetical protein